MTSKLQPRLLAWAIAFLAPSGSLWGQPLEMPGLTWSGFQSNGNIPDGAVPMGYENGQPLYACAGFSTQPPYRLEFMGKVGGLLRECHYFHQPQGSSTLLEGKAAVYRVLTAKLTSGSVRSTVALGHEANGKPLYPCVVEMTGRGRQPGKTWRSTAGSFTFPCEYGYGGRAAAGTTYSASGGPSVTKLLWEIGSETYPQWLASAAGRPQVEAIALGREESGQPLYLCRAQYNGGVHIGKMWRSTGACAFGWGSIEAYGQNPEWFRAGWMPSQVRPFSTDINRAMAFYQDANGMKYHLCRYVDPAGSAHPGWIPSSGYPLCHITFRGRALYSPEMQLLPASVGRLEGNAGYHISFQHSLLSLGTEAPGSTGSRAEQSRFWGMFRVQRESSFGGYQITIYNTQNCIERTGGSELQVMPCSAAIKAQSFLITENAGSYTISSNNNANRQPWEPQVAETVIGVEGQSRLDGAKVVQQPFQSAGQALAHQRVQFWRVNR